MPTPLKDVCCNHGDVDPISLEPISGLQHFFYLHSKSTGRVEACDAPAWLQYFGQTPEKWPSHPCTREKLDASDIWDCYLASVNALGNNHADVAQMRTDRVIAQVKEKCVQLRARSPLFQICIRVVRTMSEQPDEGTKLVEIVYDLVSSADPKQKINGASNRSLRATVPRNFGVSITR